MGGRRVGLYTLGCKVSQYETRAIAEDFLRLGWEIAPFDEACDAYVINTCTVTAESDRKSAQFIRRACRRAPGAIVVATGCSVQREEKSLCDIPGLTYLCGTNGKMQIARRVTELAEQKAAANANTPSEISQIVDISPLQGSTFEPMCITGAERTRVYVKIEDGCECRCSYCAIPDARGPVRSKAPDDVIKEVRALAQSGTAEVVLTGIETASYGKDLGGVRLIDLLERVDRECGVSRIRLGSLTPEVIDEDFVTRISGVPSSVPHFHLSVQSGCDNTLRAMRRRYLTGHVLWAMDKLRAVMPRVQFTADLMVGFPGETDSDFEETLAFIRRARFLFIHIFIYSRRAGTPAASMEGQISPEVARERSRRAIELRDSIRREILSETVSRGLPLSAVLETEEGGYWQGHSDSFIPVRVESGDDLHGRLCMLKPAAVSGDTVICRLIEIVK